MPKATAAPAPWVIVVTTIVGFLGAMVLILASEDALIAGAESWPGGPMGFAVTLGFLGALGLLVAAFFGVAGKWPHRVGPRLRVGAQATRWIMAGSGVISALAILTLLSSVPTRRTTGAPPGGLEAWLAENAPSAPMTGLAVTLIAVFAGALVLAGNIGGDTPRERADLMVRMCAAMLVVAALIAMLVSSRVFQDDYFTLADAWPGGPMVFLPCAGACVVLGIAGAVWAANRRERLTRPGSALLVVLSLALTGASLSVLFATAPPRDYRGPVLCDEGFYCLLDQAHSNAGLAVGLGWLAVPVAAVVLGYVAVKASKRRR
ncbi:hypothetical protein ACFVUW_22835 [Streptomyces xiamenensis]|uniref:hypothetical protein n=1 Tax=Streptomyces xiamenensis TaxID=408015 RepID=UPI0036E774FD